MNIVNKIIDYIIKIVFVIMLVMAGPVCLFMGIKMFFNIVNMGKIGEDEIGLLFIYLLVGTTYLILDIKIIKAQIEKRIGLKEPKESKESNKLKEYNDCYYGYIIDVLENNKYILNGIHPKYVICSVDIEGSIYTFKSKHSYKLLDSVLGEIVPVYINKNNMKKYYVDISSIESDS